VGEIEQNVKKIFEKNLDNFLIIRKRINKEERMKRKDTALLIKEWKKFNEEEELIFRTNLLLERKINLDEERVLEESFSSKLTDWLQTGFDIAGFIPGIGEGFDAINALISLSRGRPFEALCSIISLFPGVGDVIGKGGKYLVKYLGPHLDDIIQGKISKSSELSERLDLKKDFLLEAEKGEGKMFKLVIKAIAGTRDRWFPFIKEFLEGLAKDLDPVELVDKIENSDIKMPKVSDKFKKKIGIAIKEKVKDPEGILKKITNIVNFIDNSAKELK